MEVMMTEQERDVVLKALDLFIQIADSNLEAAPVGGPRDKWEYNTQIARNLLDRLVAERKIET